MQHKEMSRSTTQILLDIWNHLSARRRYQFFLLLLVMLLCGISELISLGALVPFLSVLSNPELLWSNPLVNRLANYAGLDSPSQLLLPSILIFTISVCISACVRVTNVWLNSRYAAAIGSSLSSEAYRRTLYQPYQVHLNRSTSTVITTLTSYVNTTVSALNSALQLFTAFIVALGVGLGLFIIDAWMAFTVTLLLGGIYLIIFFRIKRELRHNGSEIVIASTLQIKALQEGLGSIRDVILDSNQPTYFEIYKRQDLLQRRMQSRNIFLSQSPRFTLESIGMITIVFLGYFSIQFRSPESVIPALGILALGAQKLLPSLQQIFSCWSNLKAGHSAIECVLEMLQQPLPNLPSAVSGYQFCNTIKLIDVSFTYDASKRSVLKRINLSIKQGERIGFVGSTGSGKSTIIDIIMGLLNPTLGYVQIDNHDIHDSKNNMLLASWRHSIAHVPQSVYLADITIAENIAFGIPMTNIDMDRVREVAKMSQIHSFIESMPNKYLSYVGERGISLSGGQRQRIGIARALYKNANILIFDEATSALDIDTENAVMEEINKLDKSMTILMIAHRLSTLRHCDRVVRLEYGHIESISSFSDF